MRYFIKLIIIGLVFLMSKVSILIAETKPLMIEITQGVIKPMPIALSQFTAIGDTTPQYVDQITSVIMADLVGSGLFRKFQNLHMFQQIQILTHLLSLPIGEL